MVTIGWLHLSFRIVFAFDHVSALEVHRGGVKTCQGGVVEE